MIVSGVCLGWLHYTTTILCVVLAQKDRDRNQTFDMTITAAELERSQSSRGCFHLSYKLTLIPLT